MTNEELAKKLAEMIQDDDCISVGEAQSIAEDMIDRPLNDREWSALKKQIQIELSEG